MANLLEVVGPRAGTAPLTYTLAELGTVDLQSIFAHFDGTGASGSFLAALTVRAQNGTILARVFPSSTLTTGDTADVTYAPFLGRSGGGSTLVTGSDGIVVTTISGGYNVAANILGSGWSGITQKTVSESVTSSTVLQNDDELFFTAAAGAFYYFELLLIVANAATAGVPQVPGFNFALGEDGTDRGQYSNSARGGANDLPGVNNWKTNQERGSTGLGTALRTFYFWGTHLGNGGVFRLLWSQGQANATPTIVYAGSIIRWRRFYN